MLPQAAANANSGQLGGADRFNTSGPQAAGSPGRHGLPPSVVISPSAPVCSPRLQLCHFANNDSTYHLRGLPRRCRMIWLHPKQDKSPSCSTGYKQRQRMCRKASEHQSASTLHDSTYRHSVSWRSSPASMRYRQTGARTFSCRKLNSATSSLISTMRVQT